MEPSNEMPTKADTGKLPIDLVPTELIRAAAEALAIKAMSHELK